MIINRNFKDFKFRHRSKKNQIIYTSKKVKNDDGNAQAKTIC